MKIGNIVDAVREKLASIPEQVARRVNLSRGAENFNENTVDSTAEVKSPICVDWPSEPMGHRDYGAVQQKLAMLDDPHVKPLNDWVRSLNGLRSESLKSEENVAPWFDPSSSGIYAKTLILLEAPGPRATSTRGSGIISIDNADQTARNMFVLTQQAGLGRKDFVPWNIVPWYLPDGQKTKTTTNRDVLEAVPHISSLLELFTELERVITLGGQSRRGWELVRRQLPKARDLMWDAAPHPSATNLNTRPESRQLILECFQRAARPTS
ncbi:uracil-DNA glycosylase [Glutamicibacter soli]